MAKIDNENIKKMNARVNKSTRVRILTIYFIFLAAFVLPIVVNLFNLQIVRHDELEGIALSQQTRDSVITPSRGTIYDRNMKQLAVSASVETVVIAPNSIKDDEQAQLIADGLSGILGVDRDEIYEKTQKNSMYQEIKKKVEKDVGDLVREFKTENKISAISLVADTKRYYPYGTFASATIGFVGTDNYGLQGVEAYYDDELQGLPGKIITAKNARGTDLSFSYDKYFDAQNGANLVLTIDEVVQHYAEKYLEEAVIKHNAEAGAALVMDCDTGEILALANYPYYDLNSPFEIIDSDVQAQLDSLEAGDERTAIRVNYLNELWRNKVVSDTYEPGSVYKTVTAAIGIEENVVSLDDQFYCPGYHVVGDRRVKCWKSGGHGAETFADGLDNSCNPIFMKVGLAIGSSLFYKYNTAFGFREKTGIDLPGEATGVLHSETALENEVNLAIASFGQTFKVTPLQMITAVSAIANGGDIVTPHVGSKFVDDGGAVIQTIDSPIKRQVISAETAATVRSMMESVVRDGTGKNAYIQGYRVAGKTATSEKTDERNEAGEVDKYISSFVGFAPADEPEVVVLVMLDEPNSYSNSGGVLCAPVVKSILTETLPYLGVTPQYTAEELANLEVAVPNAVGVSEEEAKKTITDAGFKFRVVGSGDVVTDQLPKVGEKLKKSSTIVIYLGDSAGETVEVPSVLGMNESEARAKLSEASLNVKKTGTVGGIVVSQLPAAGTQVSAGSIVTIEFGGETGDGDGLVTGGFTQ